MFTINNSSQYEPSPDILYTIPLLGADPWILVRGAWIFFQRQGVWGCLKAPNWVQGKALVGSRGWSAWILVILGVKFKYIVSLYSWSYLKHWFVKSLKFLVGWGGAPPTKSASVYYWLDYKIPRILLYFVSLLKIWAFRKLRCSKVMDQY